MPYLTSAESKTARRTFRYFVEMASDKLNHEGVPERFKIVDVVVVENSESALKALIAATGWLKGYTMVAHWFPDDCPEF